MIDRAANRRRLDELQATTPERQGRLMQMTRWTAETDAQDRIVIVVRTVKNTLRVPIGDEQAGMLADQIVMQLNLKRTRSDP